MGLQGNCDEGILLTWSIYERPACILHLFFGFAFTKEVPKNYGFEEKEVLCLFKDGIVSWAEKDLVEDGLLAIERARKEPGFLGKIKTEWKKSASETMSACEKILTTNIAKATDKTLLELLQELEDASTRQMGWGVIWDYWDFALNQEIECELKKTMGNSGKKEVLDTFNTLTMPVEISFVNKQELALLEITEKVFKKKGLLELLRTKNLLLIEKELPLLDKEMNALVDEHVSDFAWIRSGYAGAPPFNREEALSLLAEHSTEQENTVKEKIFKLKNFGKELKEKKKNILKKINSTELNFLAGIIDKLGFLHDSRKEVQMNQFLCTELIVEEIGKRTGLSLEEMRFSIPTDYPGWLEKKKGDKSLCEERRKYSFFIFHKDKLLEYYGNEAKEKEKQYFGTGKEEEADANEIAGMSANAGTVTAKVRILLTSGKISEMKQGEILVTAMTTPDFVPAMRKAAAIITDEGGILCHAAIVSRELGIPCIVGTKIATKILKTGETVEVRANHGIVRKL